MLVRIRFFFFAKRRTFETHHSSGLHHQSLFLPRSERISETEKNSFFSISSFSFTFGPRQLSLKKAIVT